jgi:hypothetical protein
MLRALVKTQMTRDAINSLGGGRIDEKASIALPVIASFFKSQTTYLELDFNGPDELLKTLLLDYAYPYLEDIDVGTDTEFYAKLLFGPTMVPSEALTNKFVDALCGISSKTFGGIADEMVANYPLIHSTHVLKTSGLPMAEMMEDGKFVSSLYFVKWALTQVPEDFTLFKDAGVAFYRSVAGVSEVAIKSELIKWGVSGRGLDFFNLLPKFEEIMEARCIPEEGAVFVEPTDALTELEMITLTEMITSCPYIHIAIGIFKEEFAAEEGLKMMIPTGPEGPPAVFTWLLETDFGPYQEKLFMVQNKWSEIIGVLRVALPLMRKMFRFVKNGAPLPMGTSNQTFPGGLGEIPFLDCAARVFTKLTTLNVAVETETLTVEI